MSEDKDVRVCFVAPHAYSLFDATTHYVFGGIEVQAYTLAVELARRPGFEVSFTVFDYGQGVQRIDNILVVPFAKAPSFWTRLKNRLSFSSQSPLEITGSRTAPLTAPNIKQSSKEDVLAASREPRPVLKGSGPQGRGRVVRLKNNSITKPLYSLIMSVQSGVDFLRFLNWAWTLRQATRESQHNRNTENYDYYLQDPNRVRTYGEIDADVYVSFGANDLTAELVACCRLNDKRMIMFAASDSDFHDSYFWRSNIRNYYGDLGDRCHYALMRAHRIITQNKRQQKLALEEFGRESVVIVNPIDLSARHNSDRPFVERKHLLWVGKADNTKQPEVFVEVAKRLLDVNFFMVLNPSHEAIVKRVHEIAPPNMTIVAGVTRDEIADLMEEALALVNTSKFEGYPNTFLEAYRAGTTVVSLNVDPNDVIATEGTGVIARGDFNRLVDGCRSMATDSEAWQSAANAGRDYVERVHAQDVVVDQLIEEIHESLSIDGEKEVLLDRSVGGRPLAPAYYQD